jgi:hypothetical protein
MRESNAQMFYFLSRPETHTKLSNFDILNSPALPLKRSKKQKPYASSVNCVIDHTVKGKSLQ